MPDAEFQNLVNTAQNDLLTDEDLGDTVLDVGINWEHFVASNNSLMTSTDPLKITDAAMQAKIDSLDLIAEALVGEVNARSIASKSAVVKVTTIAGGGQPITGYFISVRKGGVQVASDFSPCSFTLSPGSYHVVAADFGSEVFAHWQDGSVNRRYPFDVAAANLGTVTDLTATYSP